MMTHRRSLLWFCFAAAVAPVPVQAQDTARAALIAELRRGGYVLYVRHAETAATPEPQVRDLADCQWQRNLNEAGRRQATALGDVLRADGVTFTTIEASPFCLAIQTAELMFGHPPKIDDVLFYHVSQSPEQIAAGTAALKARLARTPASGNAVLVGHAPPFKRAAGIELSEGQGAFIKPGAAGAFKIVALVSPDGISPAP